MRAGGSGDRVARAGSSPTTRVPWRRNATPQQVSGTLVCSYRDGVAAVTWTTEADLREKRAQRSLFGVSGRWGRPPVGSSFTQSLSPSKRIFSRVVNDVSSPCSAITTSIFTARSTTGTFGNRDSVLKKANDTMAYFSEAWRYCTSLVPDWIRKYYANNPSSRLNRTLATTNRRKTAEAPAALLPAPAVRPRHRFVCLLALRLWPAVRCAQGHGLRCAPGPRARKLFPVTRCAHWENFAPGPCTPRPSCRPTSPVPEGKPNGRQRPSPKGTAMTDTITAVGSQSLWRNLTPNGERLRMRQERETSRRPAGRGLRATAAIRGTHTERRAPKQLRRQYGRRSS